MTWTPRIAILGPYWTFWEAAAGDVDLRLQHERRLASLADVFAERGFEAVVVTLLDDADRADAVAEQVGRADVVLVPVTMAAPPTHVLGAIGARPLVVWSLDLELGHHAEMSAIVQDGATVGAPLLTSSLLRDARPFTFISGPLDDDTLTRCAVALRAEALPDQLPGLRLARLGDPIPGYRSVDAADDDIEAALGLTVIRVPASELRGRSLTASDESLEAVANQVAADFDRDAGLDDDALDRSLRLVAGLRGLVDDERLAGGAVNCHVAELRHDARIGVTPCFALGDSTGRGVPWTCTGDVLTAVAMLVAHRLGGAAFYHEIEALDPSTGDAVLANSGEHDLGWASSGRRPQLRSNPWFASDARTGAMAWFPLRAGPATLVGFAPAPGHPSGFRLVAAGGDIVDRTLAASPTVGGVFRFADHDPRSAWERWVNAGVNHHSALAPGNLGSGVATVAARLGLDGRIIC